MLQGVWVDLPWRLKFLRLTSGKSVKSDRTRPTTIFVASSIKSIVVLILIFYWNLNQIRDTWETGSTKGSIVCLKRVSQVCMAELNFRKSSLASCTNASATCIACPSDLDFSSGFVAYNEASVAERRVLRETTWWRGACWHDPDNKGNNATAALRGNTSASASGYACIPEMKGVNGRPMAGQNSVRVPDTDTMNYEICLVCYTTSYCNTLLCLSCDLTFLIYTILFRLTWIFGGSCGLPTTRRQRTTTAKPPG